MTDLIHLVKKHFHIPCFFELYESKIFIPISQIVKLKPREGSHLSKATDQVSDS